MKKEQLKEEVQSIIMELESNGEVSFGGRFGDRYLIQDREAYLREPNSRESDITPSVNYIFHDSEVNETINFRSLNSLKKFIKNVLN